MFFFYQMKMDLNFFKRVFFVSTIESKVANIHAGRAKINETCGEFSGPNVSKILITGRI